MKCLSFVIFPLLAVGLITSGKSQPTLGPLASILGNAEVTPPIAIPFSLPAGGFVTLVIEDGAGRRVRNLISEVPFAAGAHTVYWDGADESGGFHEEADGVWRSQGALVDPGDYHVRGLFHDGTDLRYEFSVYTEGRPPWRTTDATGRWLADHTPPSDVVFLPGDVPQVMIASFVAEGGDGLVWTDLEGRKTRGLRWTGGAWTGASYLARDAGPDALDDVEVYTAASWPTGSNQNLDEAELRFTALAGGKARPILAHPFGTANIPRIPMPVMDDRDKRYVAGLAAHNGLLVASLDRHRQLMFIDAREGTVLAIADAGEVQGVAFDPEGRLLSLQGEKLLRFTLPEKIPAGFVLPQPEVIVEKLEDPRQVALDDQGNIYISEWGGSHHVKVFTPGGRPLRTIGTAGVPKAGPYDETRMNHPNGLTLTRDGHLWVAEHDYLPKRISIWTREGEFVRGLYGPPNYGGGGTIDPKDKTRFYYVDEKAMGGLEFELDWEDGTSRLAQVYHRPDPTDPARLPGTGAQMPIYHGGRQYMTNQFNVLPASGSPVIGVWQMEDGVIRPVAAMGDASGWPLLREERFKPRLPEEIDLGKFDENRSPLFFAWSDRNGDGEVQPGEVTTRLLPPLPEDGNLADKRVGEIYISQDLEITTTYGNHLKPGGFTDRGVPLYDAADLTEYQITEEVRWSTGARMALPGGDGITVLTGGPLRGFRDGKRIWSYPNPWPSLHEGHNAPPHQYPGQLLATTRPISPPLEVPGSDIGEIWAYNGDPGQVYLMSMDGLFVSQLFQNTHKASLPHWDSLPAERGMSLNDVAKHGEDFWPTLNATADGNFYIVTGKEHSSIVRVDGLDTIRRLSAGTVTVTPDLRLKAGEYALLRDAARQDREGVSTLRVALRTAAPNVDGKLGEWKDADWVRLDDSTQAAVAVSGDRIYAAFRSVHGDLLDNSPEALPMIFKTGGALDLMIGTDPDADPKRGAAVAGDLRLLVTRHEGRTLAALYHPVSRDEKKPVPFASPWRTVIFDRVDEVGGEVELASAGFRGEMTIGGKKEERNLTGYEFSIPVALVGLNPSAGLSVSGDIGILRGSAGETRQRLYWHNKATGLVNDVPGEAMLTPRLWGTWKFE